MKVINTYHLNIPSQLPNCAFLACCCEDSNISGFYAVYIGMVNLPNVTCAAEEAAYVEARKKAANWVMFNGEKQSWEKAKLYFPDIPSDRYRH